MPEGARDKKGLAITILEGKKPEEDGGEYGDDDMYEAAAANVMGALESGDTSEFSSALRDFVGLCK